MFKKERQAASSLAGTWELREDQRGMRPTRQHAPGSGHRYLFTQLAYEHIRDGALDKKGPYRVVADSTVQKEVGLQLPAGQFSHRIIFDDDTAATKTFFHLSGDTLVHSTEPFYTRFKLKRQYR